MHEIFPNLNPGVPDQIEHKRESYTEGAMVGMRIENCRNDDNSRIKCTNFVREDLRQPRIGSHQKRSNTLILKIQKSDASNRTAERDYGGKCLPLPSLAPANPFFPTDFPPPFPKTLRPQIIVSIRSEQNTDRNLSGKRPLQEASRSQGFVVGVRGNK